MSAEPPELIYFGGFLSFAGEIIMDINIREEQEDRIMKRIFIVFMVLLLAGLASNVYGAELSYDPGSISVELAPGQSADKTVTVKAANMSSMMIFVGMAGNVSGGNLPAKWLGGPPSVLLSDPGTSDAPLSITVPEGTEAGTYYGIVLPLVQGSMEPVELGDGIYVSVEVRQACSGTPEFSNMKIGPDDISARRNKQVEVVITGSVSVPEGCELSGLTYTLEDEYGELGTGGPKDVEVSGGGTFTINETVNASRKGDDKDGRTYTITVSATDAMGNEVSEGFVVTVSHDNRGGNSGDARENRGNGKAKGADKGQGNGPDSNNGKAKGKDK